VLLLLPGGRLRRGCRRWVLVRVSGRGRGKEGGGLPLAQAGRAVLLWLGELAERARYRRHGAEEYEGNEWVSQLVMSEYAGE
jgi:hypothetical protein